MRRNRRRGIGDEGEVRDERREMKETTGEKRERRGEKGIIIEKVNTTSEE